MKKFPLKEIVSEDSTSGAKVRRFMHDKASREQIFYYCSPAITADNRYIPCWSDISGFWEIHSLDTKNMESIQLSEMKRYPGEEMRANPGSKDEFPSDSPCLSSEYNKVFYPDGNKLAWAKVDGSESGWLLEVPEEFRMLSSSARGRYLAFSYVEKVNPPMMPNGKKITPSQGMNLYYRPRSIIVSVDIETGDAEYVWGDMAYIGHVEMCPFDDNLIMYVDQSAANRQQEVFVVGRKFADDKQPLQVLAGQFPNYRGRTMDYIGHSFFSKDGFIAGQYVEMGGVKDDYSYSDRSEFNVLVKPDGTMKRKTKFPGHFKPCHVHCQKSDGLWVGDHLIKEDGTPEKGWLSLIYNDFTTQELVSKPLCHTNHCWTRPFHVHPWISPDDKFVVCSYNTGALPGNPHKGDPSDNHMAIIEIPENMKI